MFLFDGYGMDNEQPQISMMQEEKKSEQKENEEFTIIDEKEDSVCQPYLVKYIGSLNTPCINFYEVNK